MKSILTIGLFASETDASKCLSLIAKALPVRDRSYSGMIEILEATPDITMSTGTGTEIHKQIGNAVPPALAHALFAAALKSSSPS